MMLETSINTIVDGFARKSHLEGYASGLKRACGELRDIAAGLFLSGNDDGATTIRDAISIMEGFQKVAQSNCAHESVGYLHNSITHLQNIINDYEDSECMRPNDDNAS